MPAPSEHPARLVLQRPDGEEVVYALELGRSVTLGRDDANTIVLPSQFVSKRHAIVSWTARGVRIEDQDSANGLTVNGLTVHAAQLSGGDVIQLGDQRLVFEASGETATPAPVPGGAAPPPNKGLRLVLAAVLTMLLMGLLLLLVYLFLLAPAEEEAAASATSVRQTSTLPASTTITPFDSAEARAVEQRAVAAKGRPVDWLYDEGVMAHRAGRLMDAYRLLHGVLLRDATHAPARRELLKVMGEREQRLRSMQAAAARAEEEMKFEESARQWEQMLALTLDTEALHARATQEAARLHQRATSR